MVVILNTLLVFEGEFLANSTYDLIAMFGKEAGESLVDSVKVFGVVLVTDE